MKRYVYTEVCVCDLCSSLYVSELMIHLGPLENSLNSRVLIMYVHK